MKYLITVQPFKDDASFFDSKSGHVRSYVIDQTPYEYWVTNTWMQDPQFVGYNRLAILNVVPEKTCSNITQ